MPPNPAEGERLLELLLGLDTPLSGKTEAVQALWDGAHSQLVRAVHELSAAPTLPQLPLGSLYAMARELPIASLLRSCNLSEDSIVAFRDETDIATASELVRYCAAEDGGGDGSTEAEHALGMLALECDNVVPIAQLREMMQAARALCAATSAGLALPPSSTSDGVTVD